MRYGKLFYDSEFERVNARWEDGSYGDGFHCGEVVCAKIPENGSWNHYRIEYSHKYQEWYFAEYGSIPVGTEIRE